MKAPRIYAGYDYRRGVDIQMTSVEWRAWLAGAHGTRRLAGSLLAFERRGERTVLAFEIFDAGGLALPQGSTNEQ